MSHRTIDTLDILKKWEIKTSDQCPTCLIKTETNLHVTIECPVNNVMWSTVFELAPQTQKCTAENLADLTFECRKEDYYAISTIVADAF